MSAIRGVAPDQPPVAATNGRLAAANSVPSGAPVSLRLNLAASAAAATAGTPRTAPAYNRQRDLHPAPRGLQERGYAPDRTTAGSGQRVSVRVDLGGRRTIQKKNTHTHPNP